MRITGEEEFSTRGVVRVFDAMPGDSLVQRDAFQLELALEDDLSLVVNLVTRRQGAFDSDLPPCRLPGADFAMAFELTPERVVRPESSPGRSTSGLTSGSSGAIMGYMIVFRGHAALWQLGATPPCVSIRGRACREPNGRSRAGRARSQRGYGT